MPTNLPCLLCRLGALLLSGLDCLLLFILSLSLWLLIYSDNWQMCRSSTSWWAFATWQHNLLSYIPYFFYIFDHLKIIFFCWSNNCNYAKADRKFRTKYKVNCIPVQILHVPVHVLCFGKLRRCQTHITWVTFGYYWVSL